VFALIKLFASKEKQAEIKAKYKAWNYWYGHAKLELLDLILEYFKEPRTRYKAFENDYSLIEKKLKEWNKITQEIILKKYEKIVKIVWL
jgi:tryptophanyl-tRNA synthetase